MGDELVQCAGNVFNMPWQEVRRVVVTKLTPKRNDYLEGDVYRQDRKTGLWEDHIGHLQVHKSTLQGHWDDYMDWRLGL